ncbi:MAG TPA: hypothetical protein VK716_00185 [Terracidiphilus sp.]|jgi:hypothetical protein|nr:hypothetical protein [Terracidiphilus sp.]
MKSVCAIAAVMLAFSLTGFADTKVPCGQSLSRPLSARATLLIDSRPAGLEIVATDQETLRVSCTAGDDETAGDVVLHFSSTAHGGKLSIEGPSVHHRNNGIQVKIEVPRRTNLAIRMGAGQLTIEDVKGDKDLDLGAGQITIKSIHAGDYRSVDASVSIGQVQASAFGVNSGGFFRSLSRKNPDGEYQLKAHVTTGQIELLGNAEHDGESPKPD